MHVCKIDSILQFLESLLTLDTCAENWGTVAAITNDSAISSMIKFKYGAIFYESMLPTLYFSGIPNSEIMSAFKIIGKERDK